MRRSSITRNIIFEFFENIFQTRRTFDSCRYGKTKAMSLTRTMIRVLTNDNNPNLVEGALFESIEYLKSKQEVIFLKSST